MNLIELDAIEKIYSLGGETVRALDGISMQIREGDFCAIVGASGSGKSTLMNILGCLDTPDCGSYRLNGRDVTHMTDRQLSHIRNRFIGFIFQGFNLVPGLTATENVELPLMYRGMPRQQRRETAAAALRQVGLGERLHHLPSQLSGGQQQRVAIARAIACRPPLILADEPTGNLDSRSGGEIMQILTALAGDGRTVIIITHDNSLAARCRRIIRIADGRVAADGPLAS